MDEQPAQCIARRYQPAAVRRKCRSRANVRSPIGRAADTRGALRDRAGLCRGGALAAAGRTRSYRRVQSLVVYHGAAVALELGALVYLPAASNGRDLAAAAGVAGRVAAAAQAVRAA